MTVIGFAAAQIVLAVLSLFFWARGIVRGDRDDLLVGVVLLVVVSCATTIAAGHSGVFSQIGGLYFLFGIATYVAGFFARPDGPVKPRDRSALGCLFIVVGMLGLLML